MKITNAQTVINLWAASVRPSVKRLKPKGYDKPGERDDRRLQARVKVETTQGYLKAKPCLWIVYVNETRPTLRDKRICAVFLGRLQRELNSSPIEIDEGEDVPSDFYVTVSQAVALLAGYETPLSERTILRLCKKNEVMNYEQGRYRYVKWSQVVERAPKRRQKAA